VFEHAGWYLTYALIGGEMTVIASANDGACYSAEVRKWWEERRSAKWDYLPSIRRENAPEPVASM
jgi:hypothetical protein